MNKPRVSVLLDDPGVLSTRLPHIARIVAEVMDQPIADATAGVRYGAGIVARNVLSPYAKAISRGLARLELGSFAVTEQEFIHAPKARRLGTIQLLDDALELGVRLKPAKRIEFDDIIAVHACALAQPAGSDERDAGLPRRGGDARDLSPGAVKMIEEIRQFEERNRVRIRLSLDILLRGPTMFRMSHSEQGVYNNLKGRKSHSIQNYLTLLDALAAALPESVFVPPSTRQFLVRHEFTDILFSKPEELESFNSWLLLACERGIVNEPEDLVEDDLQDADEAIVVDDEAIDPDVDEVDDIDDDEMEDNDSRDELHDLDDEDQDDEDDDDTTEADRAEAETQELIREAQLEAEVQAVERSLELDEDVLEHFGETAQFSKDSIRAMIEDAEDLDDVETLDSNDPDVTAAATFFDASSGAWNVDSLLTGDPLEGDDLDSKDPDEGAGPPLEDAASEATS